MAKYVEQLCIAMDNDDILKATLLIHSMRNQGCIDERHSFNRTSLMHACRWGHSMFAELLVAARANVNVQSAQNLTPLMEVSWLGNVHLVKLLLNAGADVNILSSAGDTALLWAVMKEDNEEVVKLLMEAGTDLLIQNDDGDTALDVAKERNNAVIVELLEMAMKAAT